MKIKILTKSFITSDKDSKLSDDFHEIFNSECIDYKIIVEHRVNKLPFLTINIKNIDGSTTGQTLFPSPLTYKLFEFQNDKWVNKTYLINKKLK